MLAPIHPYMRTSTQCMREVKPPRPAGRPPPARLSHARGVCPPPTHTSILCKFTVPGEGGQAAPAGRRPPPGAALAAFKRAAAGGSCRRGSSCTHCTTIARSGTQAERKCVQGLVMPNKTIADLPEHLVARILLAATWHDDLLRHVNVCARVCADWHRVVSGCAANGAGWGADAAGRAERARALKRIRATLRRTWEHSELENTELLHRIVF